MGIKAWHQNGPIDLTTDSDEEIIVLDDSEDEVVVLTSDDEDAEQSNSFGPRSRSNGEAYHFKNVTCPVHTAIGATTPINSQARLASFHSQPRIFGR